jgi:hypothetical protein
MKYDFIWLSLKCLEEIYYDSHIHLDDLSDGPFALVRLLTLLNFLLKFIICNVFDHKLDTDVTILSPLILIRISGKQRPGRMMVRTICTHDILCSNIDTTWVSAQVVSSDESRDDTPLREASTRDISWLPGKDAMRSLILVIVRIMDRMRLDSASTPTECGMALSAPHLVTSINLEDHCGAIRAIARVPR